jgi:putative transposase
VLVAYKYRLYPNKEQQEYFTKCFGCVRFIYNRMLSDKIDYYKETKQKLNNTPAQYKKEFEWLKEVDSLALANAQMNLQTAYNNFFKRPEVGFPKFKSKKNNHKSYKTKYTNGNIQVLDKNIKLPKLGLVKAKVSRGLEGRIINATISQMPSGKYFVSICCTEVKKPQTIKTGAIVGIDLGIKEFVITSDGQHIENPKCLRKAEKKLARLQKELSRKTIGSSNRNKARIKVARQHEKIANQRKDFLHKISTKFIQDYDIICLETLKVKNMVKNHKLAKAISDVSWSEFVRQLQYKAEWNDKIVQQIDSYFASSQTCSVCGYKNADIKDLSVREWECPECNTIHGRDDNAAINILNEGLRLLSA